jgi:Ca2+ transporting ATPase
MTEEVYPAFLKTADEVMKHFGTDPVKGLNDAQVKANREKYGSNVFPPPPKKPIWKMILEQFEDKMVIVLLFAVVLGFVFAFLETDPEERTTAFIEPWVIIVILALNATISVLQEIKANDNVDALKAFQPNNAHVIRNGEQKEVDAAEIVCGDLVEVGVGEQVPADCRIIKIKSTSLKADQASLTGESAPASKQEEAITKTNAVLAEKHCICFSGCPLVRGRFEGVAVAVGFRSEIGKIKKNLDESEETQTPLQIQLDKFGTFISKAILVICIITWVANIGKFDEAGHGNWFKGALSFFKIAVSLAVAAIPEGLPAVVTTTLSLGVTRMAQQKAIVTQLPAVETLGCTSVICSDKTGTLTTNQMVVRVFSTVSNGNVNVFDVEGNSYDPSSGVLKVNGSPLTNAPEHKGMQQSAMVATLCNDAKLLWDAEKQAFARAGEPTEAALKVLAEKIGLPDAQNDAARRNKDKTVNFADVSNYWEETCPKRRTHEFTRDRKSMSVIVGKDTLVAKGAYEVILGNCTRYLDDVTGEVKDLTEDVRQKLDHVRSEWSSGENTFRCLGLAYKEAPDWESWAVDDAKRLKEEYETGLVWCGAVGIIDPPRDTVKGSIEECHKAGIRVIMCTGDNPETATAIAKKIGLIRPGEDPKGHVFTGNDWEHMKQEERETAARNAMVLARVEPLHKQQLVDILQNQGHVVAMTGDGVNDAPALKKADIGIAMGTGTQVAKDAAKMILSDDSFSTIVAAVAEGRAIYNNTTAFIRYLLTCNIGEVVSCFVSSIIGGPNLLRSTQLLFVNLVTDGLPATALGVNPAEPGVMELDPRPKDENIVNGFTLTRYIVGGIYLGFATIAAAYWWYLYDPEGPHISLHEVTHWIELMTDPKYEEIFENDYPSTMAMSVLVVVEMFSAMTAISERQSVFVMPPWKNPYLILAVFGSFLVHVACLEIPFMRRIFSVVSLDQLHWIVVVILGLPTLLIEEIFKAYSRAHIHHHKE